MMCYRYAVTHAKWLDNDPPEPKPPGGDHTWRLVSVVSSGTSGSQIAFYWIREFGDPDEGVVTLMPWLTVACPKCKASAGSYCVEQATGPTMMASVHTERVQAYNERQKG